MLIAHCFFIRYHDESDWNPLLYPYQQTGANVLYFTFIDPATMLVPLSFRKLGNKRQKDLWHKINCNLVAMTRGQDTEGAVPADTTIIFAIGGWDDRLKAGEKPLLWRPGMNTVSIQTLGPGWKVRRQQKRWRFRWPFLSHQKHTLVWNQVAHWGQYGADGIDLDLETGAGDQPVRFFHQPHSFFFATSWFFLIDRQPAWTCFTS